LICYETATDRATNTATNLTTTNTVSGRNPRAARSPRPTPAGVALTRSGLPVRLRFHDLRHSYATWLVTAVVPVNVVQRVMGHARASTTLNCYTHTPSDYEDRVRAALDADADFSLTSGTPEDPEEGDDPGAASLVPA